MVLLAAFLGLGLLGLALPVTAALMIFMFLPFVVLGIYIIVDNYRKQRSEQKVRRSAMGNPRSVMYGYRKQSRMPKIIALAVVGGLIGLFVGIALATN